MTSLHKEYLTDSVKIKLLSFTENFIKFVQKTVKYEIQIYHFFVNVVYICKTISWRYDWVWRQPITTYGTYDVDKLMTPSTPSLRNIQTEVCDTWSRRHPCNDEGWWVIGWCGEITNSTGHCTDMYRHFTVCCVCRKVHLAHTHYWALGSKLIPVYRQSTRRWLFKSSFGGRLGLPFAL